MKISNIYKILIIVFSSLFIFPSSLDAKIYIYIDNHGIKRYSNKKPPDDAKLIKVLEEHYSKPDYTKQQSYTTPLLKEEESTEIIKAPTQETKRQESEPKVYKKKISDGIFEVNGYEINVIGHQSGNVLHINGRVNGGKDCGTLKVTIQLKSIASGEIVYFSTNVYNVGGAASRLIDKKTSVRGNNRIIGTWITQDVSVNCAN